MDHKITGDSLMINEVFYDSITEQSIETDFTLPDYCPDIGKILKCRAVPRINVKTLTSSGLNIEGTTRLEVIYIDGSDKHIRCCEHDLPFSINVPIKECPENSSVRLNAKVEYVNCRALSQRRVDIRGAFAVSIKIISRRNCEILTDAEGAGIRLRREELNISSCIGRSQNSFTISEALELAAGKPPIASIIRSSACIHTGECKAIANKLILKGEAVLKIVYTTEPDGSVESMEYSLPFNQFLDMQGADDSSLADCTATVTSLEIGLRTDADGEYRRMNVDIRAVADAAVYVSRDIAVISDAYSVDCELKLERRHIGFERCCGTVSGKTTAVCGLEFEKEIARIHDIWCEFDAEKTAVRSGAVEVSGNITVCAIAGCADEDKEYAEKTVPFEFTMPLSENIPEGHANAVMYVQNCSYTLSGASAISVKIEMLSSASVYEDIQMACICGIEPDETRIKTHTDEPALVVYFAEPGESLWEIAREHNASVDTIRSENELAEDVLQQECMLLISVR